MKRIIALILSLTVLLSMAVVPAFSVSAADTEVKKLDFNDLTSSNIEEFKKTLVAGGGYAIAGLTADSAIKYGDAGNSLKMGGVSKNDHRIKFTGLLGKDTLAASDKGKKYTVSAYVYSPNATVVSVGLFGATGTANAYTATAITSKDIPAAAWTLVQLGIEVNDEMITNNTTQIGFEQKNSKTLSDVIYIDEIVVTEGSLPAASATEDKKEETTTPAPTTPAAPSTDASSDSILKMFSFDDWSEIDKAKFMGGGSYSVDKLSLSTEFDHTSGKGKSLCVGQREGSGRIKFVDVFSEAGLDTTFKITAWVYSPKAASVSMGVYSTQGTDYAMSPIKSVKATVNANEWTEVVMEEYEHTNSLLTQLGFEPNVDTVYIDDISIVPEGMEIPSPEDLAAEKIPEDLRDTVDMFNSLDMLSSFIASFDAEATLKRDNFASVLADFLPNNTLTPVNTKYSDVTSANPYSGAIQALTDVGVLKGDDRGLFNPSNDVTGEEAVTALVSFLGYEIYALGNGGYPTGYLTTASKVGLLDGVGVTVGKAITQADFLRMMDNFIKIDILQETEFGDTTKYSTVEGETLLAKNFDIYYDEGKVYGTPITMLSTSAGVGFERVQIEDAIFKTSENVNDLLGYQVEYFYEYSKTGVSKLVYIAPIEGLNDVITISPDDYADNGDASRLYYYDENGSRKNVKFDGSQNMIYNGVYEIFDRELLDIEEGDVRFLDSDLDGIYETVFVNDIYYVVVESVDKINEIIYDKYDSLKNIDFDSTDLENPVKIFNESGKEITINDLKEWDILSIRKSTGSSTVINVVMARKAVKGDIEGIIKDDDGKIESLKIKGEYYDVSKTFTNMFTSYDEFGDIVTVPSLNQKVTLYLSDLGTVVTYDKGSSRVAKLGFLFNIEVPEGSRDKMTLEILTEDNKLEKYAIAEKIYENNSTTATAYRTFKAKDTLYDATTYEPKRQILMYDLNGANEINKIWYFTGNSESGAQENEFYRVINNKNLRYRSSYGTVFSENNPKATSMSYLLADDMVFFQTPNLSDSNKDDDADISYYAALRGTSLPTEANYFTGYTLCGDELIIDAGTRIKTTSLGETSSMFMVSDVSIGVNDEDEEIRIVTGLTESGEEKTVEINTVDESLTPGDIISYETTPGGDITFSKRIDYVPNADNVFGSFGSNSNTYALYYESYGNSMRILAIPYRLKDGFLYLQPNKMTTRPAAADISSVTNIQIFDKSLFSNVYVFDTENREFKIGTIDEIITAETDPVNYTPVWMYNSSGKSKFFVIYK